MEGKISLILKGIAMGIAEIIPGVSGGTIAFITGIYERLLNAIKGLDLDSLKLLFKGDFKGFFTRVDGNFIITLFGGMVIGLISGTFIITYLIENFKEPLWGFFFGLILASVLYIGKQVKKWDITNIVVLFLGIAIAYFIVAMQPMHGNTAYWYVFISGMIAISALIMPGISGSFILLILGMYTYIVPELKNFISTLSISSFIILFVFGLGMLTGLFSFARVMSWAFKNYNQKTLVMLTGFMIGSLYKIWPWRMPLTWLNKEDNTINNGIGNMMQLPHKSVKVITETLVLPSDYSISDPMTAIVIISLIVGFFSVLLMERFQAKTNN